VPDTPIIPFIEGDGNGARHLEASRRVFDAAVGRLTEGSGEWLGSRFSPAKRLSILQGVAPGDTVDAIRDFRVAIKGR